MIFTCRPHTTKNGDNYQQKYVYIYRRPKPPPPSIVELLDSNESFSTPLNRLLAAREIADESPLETLGTSSDVVSLKCSRGFPYTLAFFHNLLNVRGSYFHAWRVCYALVLLIGTLALDLLHSLDNVFGLPNHTARQRQD